MMLDKTVMAILLGCMVLIGGIAIITEQEANYNFTSDNTIFENVTDITDSIYQNATKTKSDLEGYPASVESGTDNLIISAYNAISNVWRYPIAAGRLITAVAKGLGVPAFIVNIFMTLMLIGLLFFVIYMIFRFKPGD